MDNALGFLKLNPLIEPFIYAIGLLSIFPIPPLAFKNVEKAKVEQKKNKSNTGSSADDLSIKRK